MLIIVPFNSTDPTLPELVSSDPEFNPYQTAMLTATGASNIDTVLDPTNQLAIRNFILAAKLATVNGAEINLLPKIKYLLPLAGKTLLAAQTPLIGAAPTNVGFVDADYAEVLGLTGATGKRFTLPAANTFGSLLGMVLRTTAPSTEDATHDVLTQPVVATSVFGMLLRNSISFFGYQSSGDGNISGFVATPPAPLVPAGSFGINVTSTNFRAYINRIQFGASDPNGGTVPTNPIHAFRKNNRYGGLMITDQMSTAEFLEANRIFDQLMVALGR